MAEVIVLTILGMVTVMVVVYVVGLVIKLTGKIMVSREQKAKAAKAAAAQTAAPAPAPAAAPAPAPAPAADNGKIIAVITAAVAAYLGTSPSNLVVKPISTSGGWALAGRLDNIKTI